MIAAADNSTLWFCVRAFVTLLAVVDPIGNVPFFVTATRDMTPADRRRVALRASLAALLVLAGFAIGGTAVLWAWNITMPAVQISGGVILLAIAMRMLSGRQFDWERDQPKVHAGEPPERASIVPLAIPLMAGPGAMSSVIVLTSEYPSTWHLLWLVVMIALVMAMNWGLYLAAVPLMRRLGRTALVALSCLMGLILAALAVQFMLDGLHSALPGLFAAR
jgi:multiple antibiotic resistance protein